MHSESQRFNHLSRRCKNSRFHQVPVLMMLHLLRMELCGIPLKDLVR